MNIEVFANSEELAEAAAQKIAAVMRDAPGPRVSLGLAGGSTPAATYQQLRGLPARWERVDAWLADERWVPHDHQQSNGRMAAATLFDHVDATLHRPRWAPWLEPEESAAHYEATLRSLHPQDHQPDLVLLGIGGDGHTASLFPSTAALHVERRWYVANHVTHLDTWRLTATVPFLHQARLVYFLVAGADKAETLAAIAAGEDFPATIVAAGAKEVTWLVDEAAASKLSL
ncbi:MAG TPA: 6-phosphogluconolactonase [Acidimicrobiia bacterium]|nr:6-phosphogluconolactonase [Acidimicrobiia bacterium]